MVGLMNDELGVMNDERVDGPVFSTGCLAVALGVVVLVLVVIPWLLWAAGIFLGQ